VCPPLGRERKTPVLGDGDKITQIPQLDTLASASRSCSTAGTHVRRGEAHRLQHRGGFILDVFVDACTNDRPGGASYARIADTPFRGHRCRSKGSTTKRRTSNVIMLDSPIPVGIVKGRRTPSNCSMCWPARNAQSARRPWSRLRLVLDQSGAALVELAGAFRRVRARRRRSFQPRDGGRGLGTLRPVQPGGRSASSGRGAKSQR
jgi:hypothetical protein